LLLEKLQQCLYALYQKQTKQKLYTHSLALQAYTIQYANANIVLNVVKHKTPELQEPRKAIDLFCDAYRTLSHPWKRCDFLAKSLNTLDYITLN